MQGLLMVIGFLTIFAIIVLLIIAIVEIIKDRARNLYRKQVQKHRFDKSPTAKCYCKDCKYWVPHNGDCCKFTGWKTADNWFCWDAEPTARLRN
ncbi:MAG: hypothetical protein K0S25_490 [Bacillus sp. (in: firmicutes)]|jgi:hypothetical protein|nr:hypothetical protein [Bacillus sp. (in: firmicutes)]